MINPKYRIITFTFNLIFTVAVFIDASTTLYRPKVAKTVNEFYEGSGSGEVTSRVFLGSRSDDEDSVTGLMKNFQSSGDGPNHAPDVYPTLDPYTKTRSTATILVDVAFEQPYKSYMLPGSPMTPQLRTFYNDVIDNFKIELHDIYIKLEFKILSLRPGPLIPKKHSMRTVDKLVPTVFVRMNITQYNSSIVYPIIIFRISQCGRLGVLGNLTISEQIIFPQYVCTNEQVYCLPECRNGAYCDGIIDCPETQIDEPKSCPKCFYKNINLVTNNRILDEDDDFHLECYFNDKCQELKEKIRWQFPLELKRYEEQYNSVAKVNFLPRNLVTSGNYRCTIDGESSSINIIVYKKPTIFITKADVDAETVIISEIEGTKVEYWCNTTDGFASWVPVVRNGIEITNYGERSSKITFREITKAMANSYHCHVQWGSTKQKVIKKTSTVIVLCDTKHEFECKTISSKRSCIPMSQKCDSIYQCDDGSDEADCNFCKEKELSIDVGHRIVRDIGDTLIVTCIAAKPLCKPISWWTRGQKLGHTGNIFSFMESLFMVQAKAEYTGVYQCFDVSKKTSINVFVQINQGPTLNIYPQLSTLNVTNGHTASLECVINYPANITYRKQKPRWIKVNENKLPANVDVISADDNTKAVIMFKKAQFSMTGIYECEATWGTLNSKVVRVAVTVNISPLICLSGERMCVDSTMCLAESLWCDGTAQCQDGSDEKSCDRCTKGFVFVEPRELQVLVGQTVELLCYYDKDCYPVKWKIMDDTKPLSSVNGLMINDNKLTIDNVGLDATNTYECYSGVQKFKSKVTVIRKVELNLSAPYAIVAHGENISVNCRSNYGKPQWRRRDSKPLSGITAIQVSHPSENDAKLVFRSPSYDSNGYYVCFVRLTPKEDELASMLMYVYVKTLVCQSSQITCDRNTKCISKSQICDSVKDCRDGEDEKMCSKCKSNLEVKPNQLTVTTFGYGVIKCVVSNTDCLPITWKFKNQKSIKNSRFHPFEDSLYIINPRVTDSDEIMCTSGQKSASALLIVKELILTFEPNQTEDSPIYMLRGHSTNILCKSNIGTPRWVVPDEAILSSVGVRYSTIMDNAAVLEISNIQKNASLTYLCEVEFSRETKRRSLSIIVM